MSQITVKAKIDGGTHVKYGPIVEGKEYTIEEEDFGDQLFHRPPGFESPHEKADRERQEAAEKAARQAEAQEEASTPSTEPIEEEAH